MRSPKRNIKTITYDSNNSGGGWWLSDDDWKNLEEAGWTVDWKDERFLGALATSAKKDFYSIDEAKAEFERITGQDPEEEGCNCCGQPHNFYDW